MRTINLKGLKLTKQAKMIIDRIPDFELEEFIDWFVKNKLEIGGGHVVEYLAKQEAKSDDKNK